MKVKQVLIVLTIVIFCSVVSYRLGVLAAINGALKSVVEPGSMVTEASYVIFTDGSTVYARDGNTGEIVSSDTDAATVINWAINQLTTGGKVFIKRGIYTLTSTILLPSLSRDEGIIIEGETSKGVILDGSLDKMFDYAGTSWIQGDYYPKIVLKNLYFNHTPQSANSITLDLQYAVASLEEITVVSRVYGQGTGIRIGRASASGQGNPGLMSWRNVEAIHYNVGFNISVDHITGNGITVMYPASKGVYLHDCGMNTFENVHVHFDAGSSADAIYTEHLGLGNKMYNVVIEGTSTGMIFKHAGSQWRPLEVFGVDSQFSDTTFASTYDKIWFIFHVKGIHYSTENSGVASSITDGTWVKHYLVTEPSVVTLTPQSEVTVWINDRNATHFQVGISTPPGTATVGWYAEV